MNELPYYKSKKWMEKKYKKEKWSQVKIAKYCNTTQATISRWLQRHGLV